MINRNADLLRSLQLFPLSKTHIHYPIFSAIRALDTKKAIELLQQIGDLEIRDHKALKPLHLAVITNNKKLAEFLIANGAKIDSRDQHLFTPLHWAAISGRITMTKLLIKHGADIHAVSQQGELAFHWAAWMGNAKLVELYLSLGIDVNVRTLREKTALQGAMKGSHQNVVDLLKKNGAIEKTSFTLFEWQTAVFKGDLNSLKQMTKENIVGLSTNVINQYLAEKLHTNDYLEVVKYLLDLGGSLELIAKCQTIELANEFLIRGADINQLTLIGISKLNLLHQAIKKTNIPLVEFALKNNADVSIKGSSNFGPLEILSALRSPSFPKLKILQMLIPYIFEKNDETEILNLIHHFSLLTVNMSQVSKQGCKNFLLWANDFLHDDKNPKPEWFTKDPQRNIDFLYASLIQSLYPELLKKYPDFYQIKHLPLFVTAALNHPEILSIEDILEFIKFYHFDELSNGIVDPKLLFQEDIHLHLITQNNDKGGFDQGHLLDALAYFFKDHPEVYVPLLDELSGETAHIDLQKLQMKNYKYVAFTFAASKKHQIGIWIELDKNNYYINIFNSQNKSTFDQENRNRLNNLFGEAKQFCYFDEECVSPFASQPSTDKYSCGIYSVANCLAVFFQLFKNKQNIEIDVNVLAKKYYRAHKAQEKIQEQLGANLEKNDQYKRLLLECIEHKRKILKFYDLSNDSKDDVLKPLADHLQNILWGNLNRKPNIDDQTGRNNESDTTLRVQSISDTLENYCASHKHDVIGKIILQIACFYKNNTTITHRKLFENVINTIIHHDQALSFPIDQLSATLFENLLYKEYRDMSLMILREVEMVANQKENKKSFYQDLLNSFLDNALDINAQLKTLLSLIDNDHFDYLINTYKNFNRIVLYVLIKMSEDAVNLEINFLNEQIEKIKGKENHQNKISRFADLELALKESTGKNKRDFIFNKYIHLIETGEQGRQVIQLYPDDEKITIANKLLNKISQTEWLNFIFLKLDVIHRYNLARELMQNPDIKFLIALLQSFDDLNVRMELLDSFKKNQKLDYFSINQSEIVTLLFPPLFVNQFFKEDSHPLLYLGKGWLFFDSKEWPQLANILGIDNLQLALNSPKDFLLFLTLLISKVTDSAVYVKLFNLFESKWLEVIFNSDTVKTTYLNSHALPFYSVLRHIYPQYAHHFYHISEVNQSLSEFLGMPCSLTFKNINHLMLDVKGYISLEWAQTYATRLLELSISAEVIKFKNINKPTYYFAEQEEYKIVIMETIPNIMNAIIQHNQKKSIDFTLSPMGLVYKF